MAPPRRNTNKEESAWNWMKPTVMIKLTKRLNQGRGACRRPYKYLERRQTSSRCCGSANPVGCWHYTCSSMFPCNNALETSSWCAG
jgi:hypothetical protein